MGRDFGPLRAWGFSAPLWRSDMRLAAIASALAIFLQKRPDLLSAPTQTAPTEGRAPAGAMDNAAMSSSARAAEAPVVVAQAPAAPLPAAMPASCSNPNALGVARVVEIDTTGGPGFGFEHFKSHDFLRE